MPKKINLRAQAIGSKGIRKLRKNAALIPGIPEADLARSLVELVNALLDSRATATEVENSVNNYMGVLRERKMNRDRKSRQINPDGQRCARIDGRGRCRRDKVESSEFCLKHRSRTVATAVHKSCCFLFGSTKIGGQRCGRTIEEGEVYCWEHQRRHAPSEVQDGPGDDLVPVQTDENAMENGN